MAFSTQLKGTDIVITQSDDGGLLNFDDVKKDILNKNRSLVIKNIIVINEGIKFPIPDGLEKIKSDADWDQFLTEEVIASVKELHKQEIMQKSIAEKEDQKILESKIANAAKTGNWADIPAEVKERELANIILTTSYVVAEKSIEYELDVITYECAYGMNIFRDLFASVRDLVGGRSKAVEKVLRDARITAMRGLREEALNIGADAVIAVDLDYSEISGGSKNGMLLAVASGTAVKLK